MDQWKLDSSKILQPIASGLKVNVSYGVFRSYQYVLSRESKSGLVYCACRIDGEILMLTGFGERTIMINLAESDSLEKIEKTIFDDGFMCPTGRDVARQISICGLEYD